MRSDPLIRSASTTADLQTASTCGTCKSILNFSYSAFACILLITYISRVKSTQLFICSLWVISKSHVIATVHFGMALIHIVSTCWVHLVIFQKVFMNTCIRLEMLHFLFIFPSPLVGVKNPRPQYVQKLALKIISLSLFTPITCISIGIMIKRGGRSCHTQRPNYLCT